MKKFTMAMALLSAALSAQSQTDALPKLRLQDFSSGYSEPLGIVNAGDSRLFIVERGGKIWMCDTAGNKSAAPFLDMSSKVLTTGDEQGLLGLVFDPSYSSNGYFYVDYITKAGNSRISRYEVDANNPDKADTSSELIYMTVKQPFVNHNGGQLQFGPDGYLYIAFGDGGDAADPMNNAQDMSTFLGKILRIDIRHHGNGIKYSIPPTNPFAGQAGHRGEIWASGLRNPWRFSFDSKNGNMWIADVGQDEYEEINVQPASSSGGENYGWSCWEGAHFFKSNCDAANQPPIFPIAEYEHQSVPCGGSITGGYVYRGTRFPNMLGKYFYTDFCTGVFRTIYKDHGVWVNRYLATFDPFSYTSFGEDMNKELYLASASSGEIYHVIDSNAVPHKPAQPVKRNAPQDDMISLFPNPASGDFSVRLSATQHAQMPVEIFNQLGQVMASTIRTANAGLNEWQFENLNLPAGMYMFRVNTGEGVIYKRFSIQK